MGPIGPPDWQALLDALATIARDLQLILNPVAWITGAYATCHDTLLALFKDLLLGTGDAENGGARFVDSHTITHFEPIAQAVANLGLVATVGWAFMRLMWTHSARSAYNVRIFLPRLLLGIALINFALPLFQGAVDVNNAFCKTVLQAGLSLDWTHLITAFDFAGPGLTILVSAGLFLGYVVLALVYVIRYALLVVLAITAPLAALCFILHDTHHYARMWSSLLVTSLLMQPLQLLILEVGFGLETEARLPLKHAFALAALFITFKVPGALHQSSSLGGRSLTVLKRHFNHATHAFLKAAA